MWVRIDDGMHSHRKTRSVTKSHDDKPRDAAPLGLWTLAASWAGKYGTDGWVPEDELDRWDSDWKPLAARLVAAGYWWPHERDGEPGFGFNDWHDYNDPADAASKSGTYGNHVRWHVNERKVDPECKHCPREPEEPEDRGDVAPISGGDRGAIGGRLAPDIAPDSGGESRLASGAIALPEPDPNPTRPEPEPKTLLRDTSREKEPPPRFEEFWDTYDKKRDRKKCETAYRNALKKPGVTADLLVAAAAAYITWQTSEGKHPQFTKDPLTWLHGENWRDERPARRPQQTRVQEHLALVRELAEQEQDQLTIPQIGTGR